MIYKTDNIDMSLVQCPYEEERGYIYIEDEYTNNILKLSGYNDIDEDDYDHILDMDIHRKHHHEYAITTPANTFNYAYMVLKKPYAEGEPNIATNAEISYWYARDILKGRFELGEPNIATNAEISYVYARDVLKGRFELGEPAIAANSFCSYRYAKDILKGRFELGEQIIATDTLQLPICTLCT